MRVRIMTDGAVFMPQRKKLFGWEGFVKRRFMEFVEYWDFQSLDEARKWCRETYGQQFKWEHQWVPAVVVKG